MDDKLSGFFGKVKNTASSAYNATSSAVKKAANNASDSIDISKLNNKIRAAETARKEIYASLGELIYTARRANESTEADSAKLEEYLSQIDEKNNEIAALNAEIAGIQAAQAAAKAEDEAAKAQAAAEKAEAQSVKAQESAAKAQGSAGTTADTDSNEVICPKCGASCAAGFKFCGVCGEPLE